MNRKGFTLIEVLAVIIILGIVLVISIPNLSNVYKDSKLRTEEVFIERLSQGIDSYIKLNTNNIGFLSDGTAKKTHDTASSTGNTYTVDIFKGTLSMQTIINSNLISKEDYVNPGNKNVNCNTNNEIIEVYKDSDYVYCYKVNKASLDCLTEEYKNYITGTYAIDTCMWSR